ncbi:MAG TPA: UDP-N-acetylmuramoyl-tripeptide--D-alanyl-D-alanine ligase [Cyclobacteriaceae bacterium]|nr:UDP-N-acetylmuramoyl-tripeptide--D-alanyl-D-alanine ligase [Cyclobacteriaceae bacterium]
MEIADLYQKYLESGKVSTDTRQITSGSVFFALKGPSFNANEFAAEALSKGASHAVIDDVRYKLNDRCILVDDSLQALQDLARFHRSKLSIPFLALTGSNGKTTSKELVRDVLSKKFRTLATRGNLNNHIGVPLTLLSVDATHEIAVIEMGANHVGEIAALCSIANPTHGFITNIGKAHIGTFGGFDNIIRGKSELYQHLITNDGTVFINSQNPILANMAKRFKDPFFYPAKGNYYHCEFKGADPYIVLQAENGEIITSQLIGSYNFENISVALCIGKYFGVAAQDANAAIAAYVPGSMRSEVKQKGTNTIILDAYNANPSSMEAALNNLSGMKGSRKVAILGDMYELEGETEAEHVRIGTLLKDKKITEAWLCGPYMKSALKNFPSAMHFETRDALIAELKAHPISGAIVLIKASRGMALEKIVEFI